MSTNPVLWIHQYARSIRAEAMDLARMHDIGGRDEDDLAEAARWLDYALSVVRSKLRKDAA